MTLPYGLATILACCAGVAYTHYDYNEKRIDYARFRQQGYLIGSGTIESACKQIAAARL